MSEQDKNIEWTEVGKILDAHALKGEVYLFVFSKEWAWLDQLKLARIRIGREVKFVNIAKVRPHRDGLRIQMAEISDRTQAELLKGGMFDIPSHHFISQPGDGIYLKEILSFKVYDKTEGLIGVVDGFSSNGPQDILLVSRDKQKIVEIPFVQPWIDKIDWDSQSIFMDLPPGLTTLGEE